MQQQQVANILMRLLHYIHIILRASLVAQLVKNLTAIEEILVQFLGQEVPLEKG